MADVPAATKQQHLSIHGGSLISELKNLFSVVRNRKTMAFAYGFMFAFVAFTAFLAFNPSPNSSAPWFSNIFTIGSTSSSSSSSIFSYFMPNSTTITSSSSSSSTTRQVQNSTRSTDLSSSVQNGTQSTIPGSVTKPAVLQANQSSAVNDIVAPSSSNSSIVNSSSKDQAPKLNQATVEPPISPVKANQGVNSSITSHSPAPTNKIANSSINSGSPAPKNQTAKSSVTSGSKAPMNQIANSSVNLAPTTQGGSSSGNSSSPPPINQIANSSVNTVSPAKGDKGVTVKKKDEDAESNSKASPSTKQSGHGSKQNNGIDDLVRNMVNCNLFDGEWVKDDSYPLYKPGSCSLIDEQFNCITNGRRDEDYQKYKWKPKGCTIPRLDPAQMLNMLRGKRLVFVGDSLNRNMWESLVCMLKGAVKDQSKVFEANGRHHFRGEASYSFIFKDYSCTVEFFVSPFLVQEWEMPDKNGTKKETLRLDLVGQSSDQYKAADIIIFNTGHWWTHEKTSKGKDYYQEGSHVYDDLNVLEAFRKALTTWARWIDAHINPTKSLVFFRGYSATHFSGGQWNSGGACDHEVEPIKNASYLLPYPSKMLVLEKVLKGMKTHVKYLNVTQMTDYRKDGHPSMYRKHNIPAKERKSPLLYQDCSHWCLPGVPDAWNEILYAELLIHDYQTRQVQKRHR